jgi:D-apionate oxidoisomerase
MINVTLIGAGGKMGLRLTRNLLDSDYRMSYVEISSTGIQKLLDQGIAVTAAADCVPFSDVVILAVPDVALEKVSAEIIPAMKSGVTCYNPRSRSSSCRQTLQTE